MKIMFVQLGSVCEKNFSKHNANILILTGTEFCYLFVRKNW